MIKRLLFHLISNIAALYAASRFLDSFTLTSDIPDIILVGALFGVVNVLVKPVLKLVFGPLVILTLGLFLIIITATALFITDYLSTAITIDGVYALLLATLVIGAVNFTVHLLTKPLR